MTDDPRLTDAIRQVHDAWIVQGPRPDYHRQAQIHLMRDWPYLAAALDNLARLLDQDRPTGQKEASTMNPTQTAAFDALRLHFESLGLTEQEAHDSAQVALGYTIDNPRHWLDVLTAREQS
jgi:hypothetical protein